MKERPILFSGSMVKAIIEGRKTQTRRIVKPQPPLRVTSLYGHGINGYELEDSEARPLHKFGFQGEEHNDVWTCPYGQPGDRLWVRESWQTVTCWQEYGAWLRDESEFEPKAGDLVAYRATEKDPSALRWRPSIHMPRWASRILLEIVSVRVERLNDISDDDAIEEGVSISPPASEWDFPKRRYQELWESINGKGSWDKNPWVWVIEFKVIPAPPSTLPASGAEGA